MVSRCSATARTNLRSPVTNPVKVRDGSVTSTRPNRSGSDVSKPTNAIGSGASATSSHWFWRAAWSSGSRTQSTPGSGPGSPVPNATTRTPDATRPR